MMMPYAISFIVCWAIFARARRAALNSCRLLAQWAKPVQWSWYLVDPFGIAIAEVLQRVVFRWHCTAKKRCIHALVLTSAIHV
jgi:hypothetical protein